MESIISTLYTSVVATGREFGYIQLPSPDDNSVAGPPSADAETTTKLRSLWLDYHWSIIPESVD